MDELDNYTPQIIFSELGKTPYGKVLVELEKCPICGKYMLDSRDAKYGLFPKYVDIKIEKQMERAGWVQRSCVKVDDNDICFECAEAGKADFLCALCKDRKPTDKVEESIGDPPEFLCTDCYESVPAKTWNAALHELRKSHCYDYE